MDDVDPGCRPLLERLVAGQEHVLGDGLIGTYLFGSAATGDFEPGISDVDTVAVLRADPTSARLESLRRLHEAIMQDIPAWDERVEVVYLSAHALEAFRARPFPAARISPGEPFHAIEVDDRWLIDWYQVRTVGIALTGPPPTAVIPPISHDEWVLAVRRHLLEWPEDDAALETPGDRAYAILSMCRGLRACRTGEHVSKREGARWASEIQPGHARLIDRALTYREESGGSHAAVRSGSRPRTRSFISQIKRMI